MKKSWIHFVLIFIAVVSVSFAAIFIRFSSAPPLTIATFRLGISSILILPIFLLYSEKKYQKEDIKLFVLAGFFLSLHFFSWITSLKYTSIMNSTVLVTTNPLFVAIFSYILFKKRTDKKTIIAIIISILGSFLMSYSGRFSSGKAFGNILALLGAVFASLYLISSSVLRKRYKVLDLIFPVYTISFLFLLLFSFSLKVPLFGFPLKEYTLFFLLALIPQVIGHSIFNWSLKFFSPTFIAITILGEPIGATLLGILFFRETPSVLDIIGGILIISGILISEKGLDKS